MATLATDVRFDEVVVKQRAAVRTLSTAHVATLLILVGAMVRLAQFLHNRSLWGDEAMLAINITGRSFAGLTRPLDYMQGAPIGFLMLEKLAVLAFGNNEHALRIVPLLAGFAVLPLTFAVARRCLSERAALMALAIVAFSDPLINYANEVKQYSSDVAAGMAILLCTLNVMRQRRLLPNLVPLAAVGIFSIFLSHTAVFFLLAATIVLGIHEVYGSRNLHPLTFWLFTAAWITALGINYILFLRPLAANHDLHNFWANAYMPFSARAPLWIARRLTVWFTDPADLPPVAIGLAAIALVLGGIALNNTRPVEFRLIALPITAALLFGMAHLFPFGGRLILFTIPLCALMIAAGLDYIWNKLSPEAPVIGGVVALALFAPLAARAGQLLLVPPGRAEMRPLMRRIAREQQPGETIYLSGSAAMAYRFYSEYADVHLLRGVTPVAPPPGSDGLTSYYDSVRLLKGRKRVWFVFSLPFKSDNVPDEAYLQYVLDGAGRRLEQIDLEGATATLYDLSGPTKW